MTVQEFSETISTARGDKVDLEIGYTGLYDRETIYIAVNGDHLKIDQDTSDRLVEALAKILHRID